MDLQGRSKLSSILEGMLMLDGNWQALLHLNVEFF